MFQISHLTGRFVLFTGLANSYVTYFYQYCYKYLLVKHRSLKEALLVATLHHIFFPLVVWLYLLLVLKPHSQIDRAYYFDKRLRKLFSKYTDEDDLELSEATINRLERFREKRKLIIITRNTYGHLSICLKCQLVRPDRCYHCDKCARCILRRDHHCPWIQVCIGFSNLKYYILFLFYVQVYVTFILVTISYSTFKHSDSITDSSNQLENWHFKLTIVSTFLSSILIQFLLVNNLYLLARNMTNIEHTHPPRVDGRLLIMTENVFDLGNIWTNFAQIFGKCPIMSFLPVWTTPGDGHTFPDRLGERDMV